MMNFSADGGDVVARTLLIFQFDDDDDDAVVVVRSSHPKYRDHCPCHLFDPNRQSCPNYYPTSNLILSWPSWFFLLGLRALSQSLRTSLAAIWIFRLVNFRREKRNNLENKLFGDKIIKIKLHCSN